jgi:hypothetical protein
MWVLLFLLSLLVHLRDRARESRRILRLHGTVACVMLALALVMVLRADWLS